MSNRQSRREQSRTLRQQRAAGGGGRSGRRPPAGGQRPGQGSWLTQPFTLLAAGLVIALGIVLGLVLALGGSDSESDEAVTALEEARAALPLDMASGSKLGSDDAPVKITMYEDFQCPFCLRFTANQEPVLVEEFVKTGKLQLIYEHFPGLGLESVFAANASFCAADQNKFWEYHNALFLIQAREGQLDTERLQVGRFDIPELKKLGQEVGIPDQAKFESCIDTGEHEGEITDQQRAARSFGITGTPGFLLNGRPLTSAGAPADLDDWREIIETAAAGDETPTPGAGATGTPATAAPSPTSAGTPAPTATP